MSTAYSFVVTKSIAGDLFLIVTETFAGTLGQQVIHNVAMLQLFR